MQTDQRNRKDHTIEKQIEELEAELVEIEKEIDKAFEEKRLGDLQLIVHRKGHAQFKIERLQRQINMTKGLFKKL